MGAATNRHLHRKHGEESPWRVHGGLLRRGRTGSAVAASRSGQNVEQRSGGRHSLLAAQLSVTGFTTMRWPVCTTSHGASSRALRNAMHTVHCCPRRAGARCHRERLMSARLYSQNHSPSELARVLLHTRYASQLSTELPTPCTFPQANLPMVDTMTVLGAAATAKLTGDRLVREFVEYVRRNARYRHHAPRPAPSPRSARERLSRSMKPSASRTSASRRRPLSRRSKKLSLLSDADLEAELENRRLRRARERSQFSRAMPSDKLAALESELFRLRREISRIDGPSAVSRSPALRPVPSNVPRLSPFNSNTSVSPPSQATRAMPSTPLPSASAAPPLTAPRKALPTGGPPPPPPPPPPAADGDGPPSVDPERQKREKLERQKRREAKKKEREQAQSQQKLTLADIIRAAGPDPMSRLKPASKKAADEERERYEKELKEREEREKREEQERVELERKALAEMGKRVSPSPARGAQNKSSEEDTTASPNSSRVTVKESNENRRNQKESSNNDQKDADGQAVDKDKKNNHNVHQKTKDVHASVYDTETTSFDTKPGTKDAEDKDTKSAINLGVAKGALSTKESNTASKPP